MKMAGQEFDLLITRYIDKEMDLPAERRLFEILDGNPDLEEEFKGQVAMHNLLSLYFAEEKGPFAAPELAPLPIWMDDFDPENPPLPEFPAERKPVAADWYSVLVDAPPGTAIFN